MIDLVFFGILAGLLYALWYWWPISMWVAGAITLYIIISDEIEWWRVDRKRARTPEERRRSYLVFWAARMGMLGTASKLDGTQPETSNKVVFWESVNAVIWLAIFIGAIVGLSRYSADAGQDAKYDSGYSDGYAAGYNTTCEIRGTFIEGDWESPDYRSGYQTGYSDGAQECLVTRR